MFLLREAREFQICYKSLEGSRKQKMYEHEPKSYQTWTLQSYLPLRAIVGNSVGMTSQKGLLTNLNMRNDVLEGSEPGKIVWLIHLADAHA
jgi:hypothetical protein